MRTLLVSIVLWATACASSGRGTLPPWSFPDIHVVDAGAAPRERLRYRPTVGQRTRFFISYEYRLPASGEGQKVFIIIDPFVIERVDPTGEGTIECSFVVAGALIHDGKGADVEEPAGAPGHVYDLNGRHGTIVLDNRGRTTRYQFDAPAQASGLQTTVLSTLETTLSALAVPLPESAVGDHATWATLRGLSSGAAHLESRHRYVLQPGRGSVTVNFDERMVPPIARPQPDQGAVKVAQTTRGYGVMAINWTGLLSGLSWNGTGQISAQQLRGGRVDASSYEVKFSGGLELSSDPAVAAEVPFSTRLSALLSRQGPTLFGPFAKLRLDMTQAEAEAAAPALSADQLDAGFAVDYMNGQIDQLVMTAQPKYLAETRAALTAAWGPPRTTPRDPDGVYWFNPDAGVRAHFGQFQPDLILLALQPYRPAHLFIDQAFGATPLVGSTVEQLKAAYPVAKLEPTRVTIGYPPAEWDVFPFQATVDLDASGHARSLYFELNYTTTAERDQLLAPLVAKFGPPKPTGTSGKEFRWDKGGGSYRDRGSSLVIFVSP